MFKCPFSDNVGLHLLFDPFKDGSAWLTFVKDEKRDTFFSFLSFLTSVGSD